MLHNYVSVNDKKYIFDKDFFNSVRKILMFLKMIF